MSTGVFYTVDEIEPSVFAYRYLTEPAQEGTR